jgi:cysteine desulfuration protein SufE
VSVTYPPKVAGLLEDLSLFTERQERFQLLIEFADRFHEVSPEIATRPFDEQNHVQRCDSEAYVWCQPLADGTFKYHFAVENPQGISARAMAVMLDETLSGQDPQEVLSLAPDIVYAIFGKDMSMGKGQGLMGMVELLKALTRRALLRSAQGQTQE